MRSIRKIACDKWSERRHFLRVRDWLVVLYDRAVARMPALMPLRKKVVWVMIRRFTYPFAIRLGSSDALVLKEIFFDGEYQPFSLFNLGAQPIILDLGANIGLSVRYWLALIPGATVVAVEPDVENVAMMRQNISIAGLSARTIIVSKCVLAYGRPAVLETSHEEWAYRVGTLSGVAGKSVDVVTIPELIKLYSRGRQIDLLKCDVEGSESEIFKNCSTWLHNIKNMIVEIHLPYTADEFAADIAISGLTFTIISKKSDGVNTVIMLSVSKPNENGT